MPTEISKDAVALLAFLLPGFAAAWFFYGLTSHPKPSQFERVIEALIFTFVVQALLVALKWVLQALDGWIVIGRWGRDVELMWSLILAVFLGVCLAYLTNNDSFHKWLRSRGLTSRTSHPSEWYCVLSQTVTYVVLHLQDGRRLYGWPKEWPIAPDKGEFYIQEPMWIGENDVALDMTELEGILVQVKDVRWVEFCRDKVGA
jgi:hypothetical protein